MPKLHVEVVELREAVRYKDENLQNLKAELRRAHSAIDMLHQNNEALEDKLTMANAKRTTAVVDAEGLRLVNAKLKADNEELSARSADGNTINNTLLNALIDAQLLIKNLRSTVAKSQQVTS